MNAVIFLHQNYEQFFFKGKMFKKKKRFFLKKISEK